MAIRSDLDRKILALLGDLSIDKEQVRRLKIRDARTITTFVEEWLVSRFDQPGLSEEEVYQKISAFMSKHLPTRNEKESIKNRLLAGETIVLLDCFSVRVDVSKGKRFISIPCLDENKAETSTRLLEAQPDLLSGGQWGAGRLIVTETSKGNVIDLVDFRPMQSGQVKLEALVDARKEFSLHEWISVLLRTMGYEPDAYRESERRTLLLRLLPLVHKNINMMELAPKGTGKSFIYSNLSRHVWLATGSLTRAQLFKNLNTNEEGLLARFDLLVIDEAQSIDFRGKEDIHTNFKSYLESGHYNIGHDKITSESGLMILANIDLDDRNSPRRDDYIRELPEMFQDAALLDRFHGIIPGWDIPRITLEHYAQGPGIKADVFGEYAHQIRTASFMSFPFGQVPQLGGDSRDVKAVERLARALSRLLMLNPGDDEYEEYVLLPAISLRKRVRSQLSLLDPSEFSPDLNIHVID